MQVKMNKNITPNSLEEVNTAILDEYIDPAKWSFADSKCLRQYLNGYNILYQNQQPGKIVSTTNVLL